MAQTSKLTLPTAAQWKAQLIEDIELSAIDAGVEVPPTAEGSDLDLKTSALSDGLAILTANQVVLDADNNPATAEGDRLEEIRVADGLPEVPASPATGKVRVTVTSVSAVTTLDGAGLVCPGAQLARLVGTTTGVTTGTELAFVMSKPGKSGNLPAGTEVKFSAPPPGLASVAYVVADMTDGANAESDPKKRRRIINRRKSPPKADNPSRLRELAMSATNAIDNAAIYPALGGPATCLTAVTAPWYIGGSGGQSRTVSAGALSIVTNTFESEFPTKDRLYAVKSAQDEPTDLHITINAIPGNSAWIDAAPWPSARTYISSVINNLNFRVTLATGETAPNIGKNIAVWDELSMAFRTTVIQGASVVSGTTWAITVSPWIGGPVTLATGMALSPTAGNLQAWADQILEIMGAQTAGECCYAWQEPWALRWPSETKDEPSGVGVREINQLVAAFDEIADAELAYASTSEPTRSTPSNAPNVLVLRQISFGKA